MKRITNMIDQLTAIDTDLFLTLNGIHNTYWDYFMSAFSGKLIWIPMYVSIAYLLFKNLDWKEALLFVIAIGLAAGLSDNAPKPSAHLPRGCGRRIPTTKFQFLST